MSWRLRSHVQKICKSWLLLKHFRRDEVATAMNTELADGLLRNVRVGTPCAVDWNSMRGDDRRRFCDKCRKNVYNFSALTTEEALALLRDSEGNLCGRLFIRQDGRVMTSDCATAITSSKTVTWLKRAVVGSVAFGCAAFAFLASARMFNDTHASPKVKIPAPKFVKNGVEKFHQWLFPPKTTVPVPVTPPPLFGVQGDIVFIPPNPPPPQQPPPAKR